MKPDNIRTTVISPGALATDLASSVTEPDVAEGIRKASKGIDANPLSLIPQAQALECTKRSSAQSRQLENRTKRR